MKLMRGDIGGAATVVATTLAIAQLGLPFVLCVSICIRNLIKPPSINVRTVTPLCENMPGPSATKPGDVFVFHPLDPLSCLMETQCLCYEWKVHRS